jgi:microfibrillar-associated protein 1
LNRSKLKKNEPKEKKKLKFMQKYYHKGAFYVDDDSVRTKDDVRKRDATEATLEDKFNKEMLPEVMQVKNFGRAGRYGAWSARYVRIASILTLHFVTFHKL